MQFIKEITDDNPIKNFYERADAFDENAFFRCSKDNELYLTVEVGDKMVNIRESDVIRFIKSYIFEAEY